MCIKFRDVYSDDVLVKVGKDPVIVTLENVDPKKNESIYELKSIVLTRVQGSNDEKSITYGKLLPKFVSDVLAEFDAFAD